MEKEQVYNDVEVSLEYAEECVNELKAAANEIQKVIQGFRERGVETFPLPHPFTLPIKQERIDDSLYKSSAMLISAGCGRSVDPCENINQVICLLLALCHGIKRVNKGLPS